MGSKECPKYPCCKWSSVSHGRTDMLDDQRGFNSCSHRLKEPKDGSAHIVNITTGRPLNAFDLKERGGYGLGKNVQQLNHIAPWAATGGMDNKLIIWDLQRSLPRSKCEHEDGVTCLLWLGQSTYVATGCVDGKVRIWDSRSGDCVRTFGGHTSAIQSIVSSSNGEYLVSASTDGTARIFEITDFN